MKKYLLYILILFTLIGMLSPAEKANAQNCSYPIYKTEIECKDNGGQWGPHYQLLAPLPCDPNANPPIIGCTSGGKLETFNPAQPNNLSAYLNLMIKIFIGICAVLSVVMIVMGGLEYMTSELISSKESGKEKIRNAVLGLILALGAYALLYTINPDLLKGDIGMTSVTSTSTVPERSWYFEYENNVGNNKIEGPFTEVECKARTTNPSTANFINKGPCFQSNTAPRSMPWYLQYQHSGKIVFDGPYATKIECENVKANKIKSNYIGTILCLQSATRPASP